MKPKYRKFCIFLALLLCTLPIYSFAEEKTAENLIKKCTLETGPYRSAATRMLDKSFDRYQIFDPGTGLTVSWEASVPAKKLCIQWLDLPEGVTVAQRAEDGTLLKTETARLLPETIFVLEEQTRLVSVTAGEQAMKIVLLGLYGEGTLPDPFHAWEETPDHLDYLLISTHPDDDVLYLGSVVPIYGAERGYVGSIAYVTARTRERMTEAENGAWAMGLRYRPLFMGFPDIARNESDARKALFDYDELLLATVRLYRTYHPVIVFAQDVNGEYGHFQHRMTSRASREAVALAADPLFDPESAATLGTWQVQKCYLHLYTENPLTLDANAPLEAFGGKDAYQVAREAFLKHKTQQGMGFAVERNKSKFAFNRFGMAAGVVEAGGDAFDNIDETLLSFYIPPTPEPTEVPTPSPDPTEAPTDTPAPTDAPIPSEAPTAPANEAPKQVPETVESRLKTMWIIIAVLAAGSVAVGVWRSRKSKETE